VCPENNRVDSTVHLRPPSFHVLSKPPCRLGRWPLLIKPDRTFNEIIQALLSDGKFFRAEEIAQKNEILARSCLLGLMQGYRYYVSAGAHSQNGYN